MQIKNLFYSLIIVFVLAISFFLGYSHSFNVPVYADTEGWQNCSSLEDQAKAFRAYCKSRDLTIEGSVADAVTTFTSDTYRKIVDKLGLNIDAIGSQVKKSYDSSNGGTKYLFTSQGAGFYSQIFSQFLYDNNLEVGDSADQNNNTVYNGYLFTDDNGNSCTCTIVSTGSSSTAISVINAGTSFIKSGGYDAISYWRSNNMPNSINYFTFYKYGNTYKYDISAYYQSTTVRLYYYSNYYDGALSVMDNRTYAPSKIGYPTIITTNGSALYLGTLTYNTNGTLSGYTVGTRITNSDPLTGTSIYLTTNNTTINNNTYGGNTYTEINNNGDVYNYDTDDPPSVNPGGGGGDSTIIDFPNLDFNIPDLDWSLGDLSQKFPFSIPFDLVAFYTVLNADPVAPAIDRNIPLGNWYTWRFQADFSQFDDYAVIIRNVEYIGFVVGLIYLTIRFVKG